tara:strand:+ start:220 stop:702 length:483 start_codon:yes stop_codon:yes gene_type:complete
MKIVFLLWLFIVPCQAFVPNIKHTVCKNIRVNLRLFKRNAHRVMTTSPPVDIILEDKEAVLDRSVSILSDNLVNEILYILKFCNLSNDSENAYIYIIMYETLWFGFKMLKSSKNNVIEENEILLSEKETIKLVKDLIFNIILYLTIKNLLIANFLVLVNH